MPGDTDSVKEDEGQTVQGPSVMAPSLAFVTSLMYL